MAAALVVIVMAVMVILGMPLRWLLRPITWPVRLVLGKSKRKVTHAA